MFHNTKIIVALFVGVAVQALPTSGGVSISGVTHWGSGCPQDTTDFAVDISDDGSRYFTFAIIRKLEVLKPAIVLRQRLVPSTSN